MRTWDQAITLMTERIDQTAATVTEGFPHYADPVTGSWTTSPAGDWTGGFWVGELWLALHRTGDARYRDAARRWTDALLPRAGSDTVFRGFLFYYGAALGALLTGDERAREVALAGARGLASLYNPVARLIPLGGAAEEASDVGHGEANIDGVQGGSLLAWAAEQTGDTALADIAVANARRHVEACLRDDGSVCQSASFDPRTGEILRRYTHKGYRDDSTWARAQAWGMIGFTMISAWAPGTADVRDAAVAAADWWLDHAPADHVSYWDFDAPVTPGTERDTSASAIAAAALLHLVPMVDDARAARYRAAAEATVRALVDGHLTPTGPADHRPPGILTTGCYNHRIGLATSNELIWGDYYLYEALHLLANHLELRRNVRYMSS